MRVAHFGHVGHDLRAVEHALVVTLQTAMEFAFFAMLVVMPRG